jgi:N-sulfoglucosamine sulfohydrolase
MRVESTAYGGRVAGRRARSIGTWVAWVGALLLGATMGLGCGNDPDARVDRPDILILLSDDHSRHDVGLYGSSTLRTPKLDQLGSEGLIFSHAFTPTPACVPSRGALMTGRYPQSSGIVGFGQYGQPKEEVATLVELFNGLGYRTGVIGKPAFSPLQRFPFDYIKITRSREPEHHRRWVQEFLDLDDGRPFLLLVSIRDPHRPLPSLESSLAELSPQDVEVPPFLPDTLVIRRDLTRYSMAVHRLDRTVGEVLSEVENADLTRTLLTVYSSDHGQAFPYAKGTLYDAGMRVPLLIRWPGVIEPGRRTQAMVSFVDLLPTLLDVADADRALSPKMEGRSFLDLLRGTARQDRDVVFGSLDQLTKGRYPSRSIRTRRYKYIYNEPVEQDFETHAMANATWREMVRLASTDPDVSARVQKLLRRPREELYDLDADPAELVNLLDDEGHEGVRVSLANQLRSWMEAVGDPLTLSVEAPAHTPRQPASRDGLGAR